MALLGMSTCLRAIAQYSRSPSVVGPLLGGVSKQSAIQSTDRPGFWIGFH